MDDMATAVILPYKELIGKTPRLKPVQDVSDDGLQGKFISTPQWPASLNAKSLYFRLTWLSPSISSQLLMRNSLEKCLKASHPAPNI